MALFGFSSSGDASKPSVTQNPEVKQIQDEIGQELAIANATELVNKITENCFEKCVQYPETSLTPTQDTCVNQCLEKYMRSWNVISKTYIHRIQLQSP